MKKPREFPVPHGQMVWTKDHTDPKPVYAKALSFSRGGGTDRYRWYDDRKGLAHHVPSIFESATKRECHVKILEREVASLRGSADSEERWLEQKMRETAQARKHWEAIVSQLVETQVLLAKLKSGR